MKLSISHGRVITLKRDEQGEWHGEGHGLRFRLSQVYGRNMGYGTKWRCRVFAGKGPVIATCLGQTLKWAAQEGARLADVELESRKPVIKHPFGCDCNDCEWFRAEHGS